MVKVKILVVTKVIYSSESPWNPWIDLMASSDFKLSTFLCLPDSRYLAMSC